MVVLQVHHLVGIRAEEMAGEVAIEIREEMAAVDKEVVRAATTTEITEAEKETRNVSNNMTLPEVDLKATLRIREVQAAEVIKPMTKFLERERNMLNIAAPHLLLGRSSSVDLTINFLKTTLESILKLILALSKPLR